MKCPGYVLCWSENPNAEPIAQSELGSSGVSVLGKLAVLGSRCVVRVSSLSRYRERSITASERGLRTFVLRFFAGAPTTLWSRSCRRPTATATATASAACTTATQPTHTPGATRLNDRYPSSEPDLPVAHLEHHRRIHPPTALSHDPTVCLSHRHSLQSPTVLPLPRA